MNLIQLFIIERFNAWTSALETTHFAQNLIASSAFFILVLYIEIHGSAHTKKQAASSPPLSDILLDRLPVVNLNFLYIEIMGALTTIFFFYQIARPHSVPYVLATLAFFTLVRRAFLIMTPFGPHKNHIPSFGFKLNGTMAQKIFQGDGDFFFSGHTGLPFLFFLLAPWQPLAMIFLIGSAIMAIAVLLMHIHYSIDVFAAPFMAYSIFILSQLLFK